MFRFSFTFMLKCNGARVWNGLKSGIMWDHVCQRCGGRGCTGAARNDPGR